LPNVGPYIYDVKFLALKGAPHIYDISRLRVHFQLTRGADFLGHQNPGVKQNHGDLLVPCSPGKLKAGFLRKMILCYIYTYIHTYIHTE
jgi:hypothetical protein